MINRLLAKYSEFFISRWLVLLYDTSVVYAMYIMANLIRHNFEYFLINPYVMESQAIVVILLYVSSFLIGRSYTGIIRQTGIADAARIFIATGTAFLILLTLYFITLPYEWSRRFIPSLSVIVIHFLLTPFFLVGSRFIIKAIYRSLITRERKKQVRVIIYGAGAAGLLTRNALLQDMYYQYEIIAFIDDNSTKINKTLEGIPVLSRERALDQAYIQRNKISQLIIAIQKLDINLRREVVESGLELGLQVKVLPGIDKWINGQLSSSQIRHIHIEELLEREPIRLDNNQICNQTRNKVVMVTGAAGSIGSEIARQLLRYQPARVILVDQAESPLYDLQFDIRNDDKLRHVFDKGVFIVANIKDHFRMEQIFATYRPQIVYHAAAYKHVPLMEENPYEAVLINVFGTKTIADLAKQYQVEKFVMVSTDKAVNPTNVMGATKRIAEIYTQSLSDPAATHFITTRFGNVLGSNGSVIPIFRRQIEKGGPVTITHKDIIRYFMTIPEACNLVLEAGAMSQGGEIFVFDMGKPVKIYDLACKMIQLSGFTPDKEIKIVETGLRPGEKLYEELLTCNENTLHTHHPKIMRASVETFNKRQVEEALNKLGAALIEKDVCQLVGEMKQIVPEFISNNSVFTTLDAKNQ